ncbi:hypothetical protein LOD99_2030 [Oopsacas minuta]|uniref:PH domain-containing protein n=1 Tax=Oopsacas minuta TaxID=111878 RepID=A0AAV7K3R7_9METZ|nr:hypothetical protein LOD99_2030 [Oopsacas minuta]
MSGVAKQGFLFMKILQGNFSNIRPHVNWARRWFQLHKNGTLMCYDSFYADQLLFTFDFKSLKVSRRDVMYPDGGSGKPWIISVGIRDLEETILLEVDCEECMEKWAELILDSLTQNVSSPTRILKPPANKPTALKLPKMDPSNRNIHNTRPKYHTPATTAKPSQLSHTNISLLESSTEHRYHDLNDLSMPIINEIQTLPDEKVEMRTVIDVNTFDQIGKNKQDLRVSNYGFNQHIELPRKKQKHPPPIKPKTKSFSSIKSYETLGNATPNRSFSNSRSQKIDNTNGLPYDVLQCDDSVFLNSNCGVRVSPPSSDSEKSSFLDKLPDYSKLLKDYWPMSFILPNLKVYKQLINLALPVQDSMQLLLNCFQHSYSSPNSFLIIQVIGELYQTYRPQKSFSVDVKNKIHFIDWKKSFASQGVVTSKIVRVTVRDGIDVRLNSDKLNEFVCRMNDLSDSDLFCISWIGFVKGIFPVRDNTLSKCYSACTTLIYRRISGNRNVDVQKFVPSHLQRVSPHVHSIQAEVESMSKHDTMSVFNIFLEKLTDSRSSNAISLPIVLVKKLPSRLKHVNCIFVIGTNHIGIKQIECGVEVSTHGSICEFWHYSDIMGWFVQPADDVVFIQLNQLVESSDNLIFLSPNAEFIDYYFSQNLGIK